MTSLRPSIGFPLHRPRRAESGATSVVRRILAWASGAPRRGDDERRSPLDKPFPFFGE